MSKGYKFTHEEIGESWRRSTSKREVKRLTETPIGKSVK